MKVLLLGATGVFGKGAAALLAREKEVTQIGLASRRPEAAQRLALEIGDKGRPVCVDIKDIPQLASAAANYDIIVNTAGPTTEVQLPALQAAIDAGVHYCDLGVIGRTAQEAFQLDAGARLRGVTAIIDTGWLALMNLMAVHASRLLDKTEEVFLSMIFDLSPENFFSPEKSLARARQSGHVDTSWVDPFECLREPAWVYRNGRLTRVEPSQNPFEIVHPSGYRITSYPIDAPQPMSLPHFIPGVKNVYALLSFIPPQLNELYFQQGHRIAKGEIDPAGATLAFFEEAMADKERWLSKPPGYPSGYLMWDVAVGRKDGRPARCICWPAMILDWTNIILIITALRILRGEVTAHGVLPPEACFELTSFLDEAVKYVSEDHRGEPLLNERFEWLE